MRQHFHRCGYLRVIALDASDMSKDRSGGGPILDELCEARRLTRCVGLGECDVLSDAQKRDLLVTRVTRMREEEGGQTSLGDAPQPRAAELQELWEDLWEERSRIVEENRRRTAEAAAALDAKEPASPSDVAEGFPAAGISLRIDESLRELRAARLDAIDRALEALATGDSAPCARCARPIEVERLRVAPDTRVCTACAREARSPS
jgi:RNA polymerase-binding transcription factor DksA